MTLFVPPRVHHASDLQVIDSRRGWSKDRDIDIPSSEITDEVLTSLAETATLVGDKSFLRVVESVQRSRSGDFDKSVPSLKAFPEVFSTYLRHHKIDGWIYKQDPDGSVRAYLVTDVSFKEARDPQDKPSVTVTLAQTGRLGDSSDRGSGNGVTTSTMNLWGSDVAKKKVSDILEANGYLVETAALRAKYDEQTAHHKDVLLNGYTEQFRLTGLPMSESEKPGADRWSYSKPVERVNRKVVNDTDPGQVSIVVDYTSKVFTDDANDPVRMALPMAHNVNVFDLATHTYLVVSSAHLERYVYDSTLADKLVLPSSHRDLLDILTTDIATFTGDIIEGKSAGNVILAKGEPGVGKTLTAEVYSELIERPLYSVHSGALGTSAESIRNNLETVFKRSKRWNAVLLLDEADVFVLERGTDITQNAIVAEFLRTLEYFDGLMFMTTNRAANIDEAILSRTAAIISYSIPGPHDQARIWNVLATNFGVTLDPTLVADLVAGLPKAAPRDVKMLLRLALRVAASEGKDLDVDIVQRSSMFRGVTWDDEAYETHLGRTGRASEEES